MKQRRSRGSGKAKAGGNRPASSGGPKIGVDQEWAVIKKLNLHVGIPVVTMPGGEAVATFYTTEMVSAAIPDSLKATSHPKTLDRATRAVALHNMARTTRSEILAQITREMFEAFIQGAIANGSITVHPTGTEDTEVGPPSHGGLPDV